MTPYLLVFAGGGLGACARHAINVASARAFGTTLPWGTFTVNVAGSLFMGLLIGWLSMRAQGGNDLRLFAATGFLGGFTTFSAFSLDVAILWERGLAMQAFAYAAASVVISLMALAAGLWIARTGVA